MTDEDTAALHGRLEREFVGKPMSSSGPSVAPDPVNKPMIRHWVDAMDDRNPLYLGDPEGAVAPPTMLQTWTMGRPTIQGSGGTRWCAFGARAQCDQRAR